jgi:hypothetical protein
VFAARSRNFENAAGVPITGLRRNETEMPYEGYSPNLIEPGFSVCRVDSHLSINIFMSITNGQWNTQDKSDCVGESRWSLGIGKPYQNRIKGPSVEAVELAD